MADLQQLFQLGQQVQGRLTQLQIELAGRTVEASAGAGLVRATVDGQGRLRAVTIDPEAFEGRDAELLADLVTGAVAEAQRRAAELVQAEMRKVQPGPAGLGL
ncbi:MAG TPA: YbaB/EbfC family nucleoid-associated protein [Gemmatimonadales bacterium]|nr:YbaB/EbfC family nucleoid-associated protein [Gemmatimonadales bacterium]